MPIAPRLLSAAKAALLSGAALTAAACNASSGLVQEAPDGPRSAQVTGQVPPPLVLESTAYEVAGSVPLPDVPPGNYPGIQNVFRLSDRIISGSEPHDAEALAQLAAWGVRTVISVDGKAPDLEGAAAAGLEYVHIPVRYGGITEDEVMQIAKSFRELEAPFYVHCFHGRHRGPAAAAIGRVALDGLERDVAIAEMRQWCSTAAKYEGLYSTVATATIPSAEETAAYDFDFAPARHAAGIREGMIVMTRVWDEVKLVEANGWQPDEEHPDIDPLRSATIFAQLLRSCDDAERPDGAGEDFEEMMAAGLDGADRLVELLTECRVEGVAPDDRLERLEAAFDLVSESCLDCHVDYRNRPR
ncbi:MAG: sulfur transferase domain-containing protein [Planctomycetota bacterium]|nr:sulfur transferase domain-containing protein [Planctomycetota bacterium]